MLRTVHPGCLPWALNPAGPRGLRSPCRQLLGRYLHVLRPTKLEEAVQNSMDKSLNNSMIRDSLSRSMTAVRPACR